MPLLLSCESVCHGFFWFFGFNNPGIFLGTRGAKPIAPGPSIFSVGHGLTNQNNVIEAVNLIQRKSKVIVCVLSLQNFSLRGMKHLGY